MKLGILSVIIIVASCAPSQIRSPSQTSSGPTGSILNSGTGPNGVTGQSKPANNYSQDAVECERKAALSQAGGKGEAFAACMRSRGYSPGK